MIEGADRGEGGREGRSLTLPNVLAALRLLASPGLIYLGAAGRNGGLLALFLALTASDWLDGKLAVWLDQRTTLGARLDSAGDAVMYGSLLLGLALLPGWPILGEWPWIAPACLTYLLSMTAGLLRFGRLPSYHTRQAKVSWFMALVATVAILLEGWLWPLRLTALAVTSTNLEAVLITRTLERPREDVSSLLEARRRMERRGASSSGGG